MIESSGVSRHATQRRTLGRGVWMLCLAALLAACASPPQPTDIEDQWEGRLALRVDSTPPQSVSAGFMLKGNASAGELSLTSPLGQIVAVAEWSPSGASLRQGLETRRFDDMNQLTQALMGATVPLPALFEWLRGRDTAAAGWEVDLSGYASGWLLARRQQPLPSAELRLRLQ